MAESPAEILRKIVEKYKARRLIAPEATEAIIKTAEAAKKAGEEAKRRKE